MKTSWYGQALSSGQGLIIDQTSGENIAVVYDGEAHTNLIAAASDALEALKGLLNCIPDGHLMNEANASGDPSWPFIKAARDAIAKAEGA